MEKVIDLSVIPWIKDFLNKNHIYAQAYLTNNDETPHTMKISDNSYVIEVSEKVINNHVKKLMEIKELKKKIDPTSLKDYLIFNVLKHELSHIVFGFKDPSYYLSLIDYDSKKFNTELLKEIVNVVEDTRIESQWNRVDFLKTHGYFYLSLLLDLKKNKNVTPLLILTMLSGYMTEQKYLEIGLLDKNFINIAQGFIKIKVSSDRDLAKFILYIYNFLSTNSELNKYSERIIKIFLENLEDQLNSSSNCNGNSESTDTTKSKNKKGHRSSQGGKTGQREGKQAGSEPEKNAEPEKNNKDSQPRDKQGEKGSEIDEKIDRLIRELIDNIILNGFPIEYATPGTSYGPGTGLEVPPPSEKGYILEIMSKYNPNNDIKKLIDYLKMRGEKYSEEGDLDPDLAREIYGNIFFGYPLIYKKPGRIYPDLDIVILIDQSGSTSEDDMYLRITEFVAKMLILINKYNAVNTMFKIHTAVVGFGEDIYLYKDFSTPLETVTLYPRAYGGTPLKKALDKVNSLKIKKYTPILVVSDGIFSEAEYNYKLKEKYKFPIILITTYEKNHSFFDKVITLDSWDDVFDALLFYLKSVIE